MICLPEACRVLLGGAYGEAVEDIKICLQNVMFLPDGCRVLLGGSSGDAAADIKNMC